MLRLKTYDATGIAPNGRLFAGDLNALQDAVAALTDLAQNISVGSLAIGESGLLLVRYGAGEGRLVGAFRTAGRLMAEAGILPGPLTTTQRNAIPSGMAPVGLVIFNSTTGVCEQNVGTDAARVWQAIVLGNDARLSDARTPSANSVVNASVADGALNPLKIAGTAVTTLDSRLSDQRTPLDNSVSTAKYQDGSVTNVKIAPGIDPAKITGTAVINSDARLSDQRTPVDGSVTSAKLATALAAVLNAKLTFTSGIPGMMVKIGSVTVALDSSGAQDVAFSDGAFPNACLTALASNGDENLVPEGIPVVGAVFPNHFRVRYYDSEHVYAEGGFPHWVAGSPTVRVNYVAFGY